MGEADLRDYRRNLGGGWERLERTVDLDRIVQDSGDGGHPLPPMLNVRLFRIVEFAATRTSSGPESHGRTLPLSRRIGAGVLEGRKREWLLEEDPRKQQVRC
ncbi:MAG: hypothetical protein OXH99_06095 [Bryobacterales bacterium]|nr:hypothetical protein [Bryobacterales bacterium]